MNKILLSVFIFSVFIFSQEKRDTTFIVPFDYRLNEIQNRFDEFDLFREMNFFDYDIPLNEDQSTKELWTSFYLSKASAIKSDEQFHFTSFQHKMYIENSKFDPVRYVLSMAQLSAAGYLAYRHIKKYGLFK